MDDETFELPQPLDVKTVNTLNLVLDFFCAHDITPLANGVAH
jgi:hypothetical protein